MSPQFRLKILSASAMLSLFLPATWSLAADAGEDVLPVLIIDGGRATLPANLPSTIEGVTARQIAENMNALTSAQTLNYLPSTHVRERYIGDRNGILVMRVNSSTSSAQTTVYADHLLLSNFLNNSYSTAPRWGMVGVEEIARVDVLYGPFSALYPGNSAGGVVLISTRLPDHFEAHAKFDMFGQQFNLYGTNQSYRGTHSSVSLGNKVGAWSYQLTADHLDNQGHPQTFGTANQATVSGAPAFTSVSGAQRDLDTSGNPRIITSAIGADHTLQDNGKIKLVYDFSTAVRATAWLGVWQNKSTTSVSTYLQDANGQAVYNTNNAGAGRYVKFADDAAYYTLSGSSPGSGASEHVLQGLSVKSANHDVWDWEVVASRYSQNKEVSRSASNTGSLLDSGTGVIRPSGIITVGDGTGWRSLDVRAGWRSDGEQKRRHQLSFGYHTDRYTLASQTSAVAADWLSGDAAATPNSNSTGKTATQALYLQDAWQAHPDLMLIAGGRLEQWRAFDGSNTNVANSAPYRQLHYASRSSTDLSPKLTLALQATPDLALRGAFGKAVRYPTVAEIFQVISLPNNVKQNDPDLKPEKVHSGELVAEWNWANGALKNGSLRTSLFWENKRDALIAQTDTTVTPNISSIQNVDQVRTMGIETAFDLGERLIRGLQLNGSVTYTKSTIISDHRNPGLAGTDQPRIPDWRATIVGTYHASDALTYSLSYRTSGRQHNALYNTATHAYNDVNPNVYGAVSHYRVWDTKILYRITQQWQAALGINNLGNFKYYVNPNPYAQRTLFASLIFDY